MADYPCDLHHERYRGPSTRLFCNAYRDDQVVALRLTVCETCLDTVLADWFYCASKRTPEGYWDPVDRQDTLGMLWQAQEKPVSQRNGRYRS